MSPRLDVYVDEEALVQGSVGLAAQRPVERPTPFVDFACPRLTVRRHADIDLATEALLPAAEISCLSNVTAGAGAFPLAEVALTRLAALLGYPIVGFDVDVGALDPRLDDAQKRRNRVERTRHVTSPV